MANDPRATQNPAAGTEAEEATLDAASEAAPEMERETGEPGAPEQPAEADFSDPAEVPVDEIVPDPEEAPTTEDLAAARAEAEALAAERDELKDRLMRALAETENVRRRAERDRKDAETYGGTKLARDLLSVHDNLARALEAADDGLREAHPGFLEGVELTQRELLNAFGKHRIEKVVPEKGEKFDPNRHQAMFEAPVPGAQNGTVIEVMQAGFVIADRLLRPALVGVARGAPTAEPASSGSESAATTEGDGT